MHLDKTYQTFGIASGTLISDRANHMLTLYLRSYVQNPYNYHPQYPPSTPCPFGKFRRYPHPVSLWSTIVSS